MAVRTCLLVSDDPDDHVELTEAIYEVSEDVIVLLISDNHRASDLVLSKRHIPDFLMMDIAVNGFDHNNFFAHLEADPDFAHLSLIVYGDEGDFEHITSEKVVARLPRDLTYSKIKIFLREVMR